MSRQNEDSPIALDLNNNQKVSVYKTEQFYIFLAFTNCFLILSTTPKATLQ